MINPMDIDLHELLTTWYGPPRLPSAPICSIDTAVPTALIEWHLLVSQWEMPNRPIKRVVALEDIKTSGEFATFLEGPTGDWRWAFNTRDPEKVFESEPHHEWQRMDEDLASFLIHHTIDEIARTHKPRRACSRLDNEYLEEVLAPVREIAFKKWRWPCPGERTFIGDSILLQVSPCLHGRSGDEFQQYSEVEVAATHRELLNYLDEITSAKWIDFVAP